MKETVYLTVKIIKKTKSKSQYLKFNWGLSVHPVDIKKVVI